MQTKIFSQFFSKPASKLAYTKLNKSFISSKSKKTLNFSILAKSQLNSLKTISYFSTVPTQKKISCRQIDDDTNELLSTLEANLPDLMRVVKNRGVTVSSLLYYGLAYINHRNIELYETLADNMLKELHLCKDIPTLMSIIEGNLLENPIKSSIIRFRN